MKYTFWLLICVFTMQFAAAETQYVRVMFRDDPATTASIGWDQVSGENPLLYYGTTDHGNNYQSYSNQQDITRSVAYRGMSNHFVRLEGLLPDTRYYFVIQDSEGVSERYWFKTCPDNPGTRLSIIAGGDSRNNRTPRQRANRLVAKLKPHVVLFGGDMTSGDSNAEWAEWMQDWQESISSTGRIIPIVAARGNHEGSNDVIYNLFDVPSPQAYYAITFGGSLIRAYTLNTEMSISGAQTDWLAQDLRNNAASVFWKIAQYHKPIRPHVSFKPEGNAQYVNWSPLFFQYGVNLVVECDAHLVKRTWPIRPSTSEESEEGFVRNDSTGTVYIGEGCWGAPLRANDDNKSWTRNSESFNQFNWIFVDSTKLEIRTIKVDNEENVGEVNENDIFTPPANLDIWEPENGALIEIAQSSNNISPIVDIIGPADGNYYSEPQFVTIDIEAHDLDGEIRRVEFYLDDALKITDDMAPYSASLLLEGGIQKITATAYDDGGRSTSASISLASGSFVEEWSAQITNGANDVEKYPNQDISAGSGDLNLGMDNGAPTQVGLRFESLLIPAGAQIISSAIQFKVDETFSDYTFLSITAEDTDHSVAFDSLTFDQRPIAPQTVAWTTPPWLFGSQGLDQQTPDLSEIIQHIVDKPGWQGGNAISLFLSGYGQRVAESYEGDPEGAPILTIKYAIGNITFPTLSVTSIQDQEEISALEGDALEISAEASDDGIISEVRFYLNQTLLQADTEAPYRTTWNVDDFGPQNFVVIAEDDQGAETHQRVRLYVKDGALDEISRRITQSSDDAEEAESGAVYLTETSLQLIGEPGANSRKLGLRFTNIDIPAGSNIEDAYIQFTADDITYQPGLWFISGEASPDPVTFSTSVSNISSRPTLSREVAWGSPNWGQAKIAGLDQRAGNLRRLVQDQIDQDGWKAGQSLSFVVSGSGNQSAVAFDGDPQSAPQLFISFEKAEDVTARMQVQAGNVDVYPSVAENLVTIQNRSKSILNYQVLDIQGKVRAQGIIEQESLQRISVRDYANGRYVIRFREDGREFTRGFIVGH